MNNSQKIIITIFILIITSTFVVFYIIYPTINDIQALNDRIQLERASLENKYTNRRNIKNIIADLKYINNGLNPLENKIIINKDDIVDFVSSFEKIADDNNLTQDIRLSPQENPNDTLSQKYLININLSGDFIDQLKYLNDLEQSPLYLSIEAIIINSVKNSSAKEVISEGIVKTNIQGYVYFSL